MIYLDGDIQVFDNIDHLFDLPDGHFYAVMDCFCENTWINSTQHNIGYCQQCPERVRWPVEMGSPPPLYFNAGMFVYEPKLSTYHDLLETVKVTPPTLFAEQVTFLMVDTIFNLFLFVYLIDFVTIINSHISLFVSLKNTLFWTMFCRTSLTCTSRIYISPSLPYTTLF